MKATYYDVNGESKTMKEWSQISGVKFDTLRKRISKANMSMAEAISDTNTIPGPRPKKIEAFGETKTIKEWSEELGIEYGTLYGRLHRGMDIEESLTIDKIPASRKPRGKRPPVPEGCYWESQYKVVCPNGQVFDHTNRVQKSYPKLEHWICEQCGADRYHNQAAYKRAATVCRACNAHNASKAHVDMWAELVEATGYVADDRRNFKERASKFGVNYNSGITTALVAERHDHICQECGIQIQRHHGSGFHPEGWSVGHIVPMSKGGHHEWDNVQAECIACNLWKSNRSESVDWDEVMAG